MEVLLEHLNIWSGVLLRLNKIVLQNSKCLKLNSCFNSKMSKQIKLEHSFLYAMKKKNCCFDT